MSGLTKGAFTPALFSPFESNPGAFTAFLQFVWGGVDTVIKPWYGPDNYSPVRLKEVAACTAFYWLRSTSSLPVLVTGETSAA